MLAILVIDNPRFAVRESEVSMVSGVGKSSNKDSKESTDSVLEAIDALATAYLPIDQN